MSECMILDETNDQLDTCTEVTARDIVNFVLEDILFSAFAISDKGCNQIGDFNVIENFCQPFDQHQPDSIKNLKLPQNSPTGNLTSKLNSGENGNDSISFLTAKESIDLVLDNLIFKEEKVKSLHECKVISEDILADNELQIQNGQIRLESNKPDEKTCLPETSNNKPCENENVTDNAPQEVCEFSSFNTVKDGNIEDSSQKGQAEGNCVEGEREGQKETDRPFTPFTTEKLRQSILQAWGNDKPSIVGGWDGDMSAQMEEIAHLIKELSSVQVSSDASVDPNRPRACAFAEEDVKKMIKEIEEINFNQASCNPDEAETTYNTDGQGDADLESKSCHNKLPKTPKLGSKSEILSDDSTSLKREKQPKSKLSVNIQDRTFDNLPLCDRDEEYLTEINITGGSSITLTSGASKEVEEKEKEVKEFSNSSKKSEVSFTTLCSDKRSSFGSKLPVESILNEFNPEYEIKSEELSEGCPKKVASMTSNKDMGGVLDEAKNISLETHIPVTIPRPIFKEYTEREENNLSASHVEEGILISPSQNISQTYQAKDSQINVKTNSEPEQKSLFERNTKSGNYANDDSLCSLILPSEHDTSSEGKLKSNNNLFFEEELLLSKTADKETKVLKKDGSFLQSLPPDIGIKVDNYDATTDKKDVGMSRANLADFENLNKNEEQVFKIMESQKETVINEKKKETSDKNPESQENNSSNEITRENNSSASSSSLKSESRSSKVQEDDQPPQQFKLHSNKMYFGSDFDPANQGVNETILTDVEESYIDTTENVLQIIDPPDSSNDDEESNKISFSLLNETSQQPTNEDPDSQPNLLSTSQEENENRDEIIETRKKYSGMTAIGPIKNINYDPKDLTGPDIDFGKMTHITSSRQLAKDIFGSDLNIVPSIRITRGNEPDDEASILGESSHLEVTSLVNRDIASLTKVQKVREVMSYYPKPEEDFEDDESLHRTRLDLKDVESTTDERYKVPDVSIPLLSFEVSNTNTDVTKEYIQNIHLVLSTSCFNDGEETVECNQEVCQQYAAPGAAAAESLPQEFLKIKDSKSLCQEQPEKRNEKLIPILLNESKVSKDKEIEVIQKESEDDIEKDGTTNHPKYCTLSRVLQKASSKFTRKDSDVILRNSKSLPREHTKMSATESIKSFLNEHHSSATNVLKKSRSLLKNTQNIFKSRSQNRFGTQDSLTDKTSPLETEECSVSNIESKLSLFLKKEEFKKAKNLIKSKVEKTFKKTESESNKEEPKVMEKDLRVAVRNEENYRIDRMENFRKILPKSPMVYKSQFVRSKIGIQSEISNFEESCDAQASVAETNPNGVLIAKSKGEIFAKGFDEAQLSQEMKESFQDLLEEKLEKEEKTWISDEDPNLNFRNDSQDVGYIVMETIQGLPTAELESCLSEAKNQKEEIEEFPNENTPRGEDLPQENTLDSPNSLQTTVNNDDVEQTTPTSPQKNENKGSVKNSKEKKIALKNKKLSARFRSFWCSAFGRVKTPPEKMEPYMKSPKKEENAN